MKVYKKSNAQEMARSGYAARYLADIVLSDKTETAGVIIVNVQKGVRTEPHAHGVLEELFIPMNNVKVGVGDALLELERGDAVLVEAYEKHWFEAPSDEDVTIIAIKLPNLKDDKLS
jgi:quercetin dioxygenase-like cupin family protein